MAPCDISYFRNTLASLQETKRSIDDQMADIQHLIQHIDDDDEVSSLFEQHLRLQKEEEVICERIHKLESQYNKYLQKEVAKEQFPHLGELSDEHAIEILEILGLLAPLIQESDDNVCRWLARFYPQIIEKMWHIRRCHLEKMEQMFLDQMERSERI